MSDNTIDIKGGSNQILPNATEAKQNIYIGDSAIQIAQQAKGRAVDAQLTDMTTFSGTFPAQVEHELMRDAFLSLCEDKFKNYNVVCLTGEEGVGTTTFLSQFVRKHHDNCVSYFFNGFDRIQLDREVIERDITEQLYWFAVKSNCPSEVKHVTDVYSKMLKQLKKTKDGVMYFVFDGFSNIPSELQENICKLIEILQWEKARFLVSGKKGKIEGLFKQNRRLAITEVDLLRFSNADTKDYFRLSNPGLSEDQLHILYKISRGNARRMNDLRTKYLLKDRIVELMMADIDADSDLNEEDYERICRDSDPEVLPLFALLSYADFPFSVNFASQVLEITSNDVNTIAARHSDYITVSDDGTISLRSEGFRKYLCERLQSYKRDVVLRQIRVLEGMNGGQGYALALPALYKSAGLNERLIEYLSADNIQRILAEGQHAKALALAQTVYLSEERLKCFLIIARKPDGLPADDQAVLKDNIRQLVEEIRFEDIPDKSMELAIRVIRAIRVRLKT